MSQEFIIILTVIIAFTTVAVVNAIFGKRRRDFAEQDRDRGLAKLFEARAEVLHAEAVELHAAITTRLHSHQQQRRDDVCDEVREES